MLDLLIQGGTIVSPFDSYSADIGLKDGRIEVLARNLSEPSARMVSAEGKLIFAGAIDAHTHMSNRYDFFGTKGPDDFQYGSASAACGGVTTFLDFARQIKGQSLLDCYRLWREEADPRVVIDYGIHLIITDASQAVINEIPRLIEVGVPSFKMYMTYKDSLMIDDGSIVDVMNAAAKIGGLVGLHCENNSLVEHARKEARQGSAFMDAAPPIYTEAEAVQRGALFALHTKCRMYAVHLSTRFGLDATKKSRASGADVFAETCPHYLTFTDEVYSTKDWPLYTVSPPMRGVDDQEALWAGLASGDIKIVASDNAGRNATDKLRAKDDLSKMPVGVSSIEMILPILHTLGVTKGRISINKMVELTSYNPAVLFGLYPKKGIIAIGSDADLVIFDPKKRVQLTRENLHSKLDHSIYENITSEGYPIMTISRGEVVSEEGQFLGKAGSGNYVPRFYK